MVEGKNRSVCFLNFPLHEYLQVRLLPKQTNQQTSRGNCGTGAAVKINGGLSVKPELPL